MVLQSGEKTVVLEVNEKFVVGCDEEKIWNKREELIGENINENRKHENF